MSTTDLLCCYHISIHSELFQTVAVTTQLPISDSKNVICVAIMTEHLQKERESVIDNHHSIAVE